MSSKKEKKALRIKVQETLSATFTGLEGEIPAKKLKRNIKKASKALLAGLKITTPKAPKKMQKVKPPVSADLA